MKRFQKSIALFLSCFLLLALLTSCQPSGSPDNSTDMETTAGSTELTKGNETLTVALYPYVPDPERFKTAVTMQWQKIEPNVTLNFVDWDCYESFPGDDLDVFVFDAIYLKDYIDKGYLLPLADNDISGKDDILDFALSGCRFNNQYYAIPQIVCTNLLYTRKGDNELASASTVQELYSILGDSKATGEKPGLNEGLMVDLAGGTTKTCMYIDTFVDHSQEYDGYFTLPKSPDFNTEAMDYLRLMLKMTGRANAEYSDDDHPYIRGEWLRDGYGRACIGYAESMAVMGDAVNDMEFKLFSQCEHGNIPLFYCDVVGVSAKIGDKQSLAVKLANVIANAETMIAAVSPDDTNPAPQYLLPARHSVYDNLSKDFSIYTRLHDVVRVPGGRLFVLSPDVNGWIAANKGAVKEALFGE